MAAPDLLLAFDDPNTATGGQFAHGVLDLPGAAGYYASTPDSVALSITGDIDIRVFGTFTATATHLAAKWSATAGQGSWILSKGSTGFLQLFWSADGTTALSAVSTVAFTLGTSLWVRATLDVDNGATGRSVKFYTSPDGVVWTQLGTTVTTAGVTSIFDSTAVQEVGASRAGTVSPSNDAFCRVQIRNNILDDGTGIVFDADFTSRPIGTTTVTESSVNAATVTVAGPVVADSSGNNRDGRAVNGVTLGQPGKKGLAATFDGVNDYVRVANWGNLVRGGGGWFKPAAIGAKQSLISQTTGGTSAGGFDFYITTAGKLELKAYDATPTASTITGGTTLVAGTWYHLFFTYDGTNLNLFVNAVADATPVAAITLTLSTIDVLVGAQNPTTPTSFYGGLADDVRIYSTAPSLGEIAVLASPSNRILSPLMMPGIFN